METKIVPMSSGLRNLDIPEVQRRIARRLLTTEDYLKQVVGTMQKRVRLGWEVDDHALRRRIEEEFGKGFEMVATTYVAQSAGTVASIGGEQAQTEAAWLGDRRLTVKLFPEEQFAVVEIRVTDENSNKVRSGIALVLTQTSAAFVPRGNVVFKFLTKMDPLTNKHTSCVHVAFDKRLLRTPNPKGKRIRGSQGTITVPVDPRIIACPDLAELVLSRTMPITQFIREHGSTTLNDAFGDLDSGARDEDDRLADDRDKEVSYSKLYDEERTAFVFGYPWRCIPATEVFYGPPGAEGDTPAVTDALKLGRRYQRSNVFPEDDIRLHYLEIYNRHEHREGIGLICWRTSAQYVRPGKLVCCLLAEYDPHTDEWLDVVDPESAVG